MLKSLVPLALPLDHLQSLPEAVSATHHFGVFQVLHVIIDPLKAFLLLRIPLKPFTCRRMGLHALMPQACEASTLGKKFILEVEDLDLAPLSLNGHIGFLVGFTWWLLKLMATDGRLRPSMPHQLGVYLHADQFALTL